MFTQYKLPYAYDALEPNIDALTMETHYSKHHATYTKNFNEAAEKAALANKGITDILQNLEQISDAKLRTALRNNGGGFYNHNLYFATMSPSGGGEPTGAFKDVFDKDLGGFASFQEEFSKLATGQFGSGWAWLSSNKDGKLMLSSSPNQDNPLMDGKGYAPLMGIDVWEHAYYLKYKNMRADYIKAFYNVIDWKAVAENYDKVKAAQPVMG